MCESKRTQCDTQKYYKIHAINSDKVVGLYIFTGGQPHRLYNVRVYAALK